MDSATLAYMLADQGEELRLLSFDYGQRHIRELESAAKIAAHLGAPHEVVTLGLDLPGSALTDPTIDVPEGHYEAESMKATVVPNRNAVMLSVGFALAVAHGADGVAFGAHAGDHAVYPDCRPAFVDAFQAMQDVATEGFGAPRLLAPFIHRTKADIARLGADLRVPWADTWSCYQGGVVHCGRCGTCRERLEAFALAGADDPTEYAP
jgi:7-cyano-7-deazaguanine synthase